VVAGEYAAGKLAIVHGKSSSPLARSDGFIRV
jgi:hypothetical protein